MSFWMAVSKHMRTNRFMNILPVAVGPITLGKDFPIAVQTMVDRPLTDKNTDFSELIKKYKLLGCDILRFAVPDEENMHLLGALAKTSPIPLVADIHYDYKLAMGCMDYPIAKIRINPGNIGASWKIEEVFRKAADKNISIRVGANGGSLSKEMRSRGLSIAEAMICSVEEELAIPEKLDFKAIVVSLKSSDVETTVTANRIFRKKYPFPLHLGITEAGPMIPALVKSTLGLSDLLREGIGETLRISISDSPEKELIAAAVLLKELKLASREGVEIISCPKCGRAEFDTHSFTDSVQDILYTIPKKLKIAVMGCPVNGPGEARDADLGITGSAGKILIFRKGEIVRKGDQCNAKEIFLEELGKLY